MAIAISGTTLTFNDGSGQSTAGFGNMTVLTSNTSWTVPTGVTKCKVTVVGAGGAFQDGNAAGGGGGTSIKLVTGLTPGGTVSVTVGLGVNGSTGGTSSFGSHCSATGGRYGSVGYGGTGTGGDLNMRGGSGDAYYGGSTFFAGRSNQDPSGGYTPSPYGGGSINGSSSGGASGVVVIEY
jgi:hypothetical protein